MHNVISSHRAGDLLFAYKSTKYVGGKVTQQTVRLAKNSGISSGNCLCLMIDVDEGVAEELGRFAGRVKRNTSSHSSFTPVRTRTVLNLVFPGGCGRAAASGDSVPKAANNGVVPRRMDRRDATQNDLFGAIYRSPSPAQNREVGDIFSVLG